MNLNLDKLKAEAERAFAAVKAGSRTGQAEWRYMSDQERRRMRFPVPTSVTPAVIAQLEALQGSKPTKAEKPPSEASKEVSRYKAIVARVMAKSRQESSHALSVKSG